MDLYVVSGATGMTGGELARQLVARGDMVLGFDNFFASSIDTVADVSGDPLFRFREYDLNSPAQMAMVAREAKELKEDADRLVYVNCAAVVHTEHFYRVEETFDTNVAGMRSFLRQAVMVGADAFVNCSTSEVYSMRSWEEGGVRESSPVLMDTAEQSQRTSYAAGKLMTEFFLKDAVDSGLIEGCSIRFANVYSRDELLAKHVIPHVLRSLAADGSVTLLENSRVNRRTFLHNADSCAAVLALCDAPGALDGTTYNVATDEEVTILELVQMRARALGVADPVVRFEGFRVSDPERRALNTDKIRSRTGWEPRVGLAEGIAMCVERMRAAS